MAKEPRNWWQVHPDDWQPIETFPKKGGPFVLANADKSRTWLSDGAKLRKSDSHELDEAGTGVTDGDEAAFWAEA